MSVCHASAKRAPLNAAAGAGWKPTTGEESATGEPSGPFGAKSVGELGINGVAAAIANGIAAATGARLTRLPMTGERVLDALRSPGGAA